MQPDALAPLVLAKKPDATDWTPPLNNGSAPIAPLAKEPAPDGLSHSVENYDVKPSPMLLAGTDDEATENDYVVAIGAAIVTHACRIMPLKINLPNGAKKKVPALVLNEHALAHVLKVMLGGGPVNAETLTWEPHFEDVKPEEKIIKATEVPV